MIKLVREEGGKARLAQTYTCMQRPKRTGAKLLSKLMHDVLR
jgi:hypothetical protein